MLGLLRDALEIAFAPASCNDVKQVLPKSSQMDGTP
jgi:hypothetical protein